MAFVSCKNFLCFIFFQISYLFNKCIEKYSADFVKDKQSSIKRNFCSKRTKIPNNNKLHSTTNKALVHYCKQYLELQNYYFFDKSSRKNAKDIAIIQKNLDEKNPNYETSWIKTLKFLFTEYNLQTFHTKESMDYNDCVRS